MSWGNLKGRASLGTNYFWKGVWPYRRIPPFEYP